MATVKWSVLEFHAEQAVAWDEYREAMRIQDKSLIRITPLRGGPIPMWPPVSATERLWASGPGSVRHQRRVVGDRGAPGYRVELH
jgi:hypothetical protein